MVEKALYRRKESLYMMERKIIYGGKKDYIWLKETLYGVESSIICHRNRYYKKE